MLVSWFGRNANVILTTLAFLVVGLAIWNIVLQRKVNTQASALSGIEITRIVEDRTNNFNAVQRCRGSISTVSVANVLVATVKSDLLQRAVASRALIDRQPDSELNPTRLKAARQAERQASVLKLFPAVTKGTCDKLAADLRAKLVAKYGDKLRQLEQEERRSRRDDAAGRR
jgi:hypothetical protein